MDAVRKELKNSLAVLLLILIAHSMAAGSAIPIIGPDVINFEHLQPVAIIYHPIALVQPQNSLPAPGGAVFDGPDPGLNANIIGGSDCPNNYRKDVGGICRLEFVYGPNPFSAITPKTFKGSLQFYMGLKVGNDRPKLQRRFPFGIRGRHRNFPRIFPLPSPEIILPSNSDDDDD